MNSITAVKDVCTEAAAAAAMFDFCLTGALCRCYSRSGQFSKENFWESFDQDFLCTVLVARPAVLSDGQLI